MVAKKSAKRAAKKAAKTKTAKKKAAKKKPAKKAAAKKKAPAKAAKKKAAKPAAEPAVAKSAAEPERAAGAGISSTAVNMGHVFALRPRVNKSFRQADFLTARLRLKDESYDTIEDAARAVATKALELTHDSPMSGQPAPKRR